MRIRGWLRRLLIWTRCIRKPNLVVARVATHPAPDSLKPELMLVVGNQSLQKWACFQCPGGCGEVIKLSLNAKQHPCWSVSIDNLERPTVSPSVRQLSDCRCHFWIRRGIVEWCADSPKQYTV